MFRVSIEIDARYRHDPVERRFVEVCTGCGADRRHGETLCHCGHAFTRLARSFFAHSWEPARPRVEFPARCPHCLGAPAKELSHACEEHTGPGALTTTLFHQIPMCQSKHHPLLLATVQLVAAFFFVTSLVMAAFHLLDRPFVALGLFAVTAVLGSCMFLLRRAKTWIRFAGFDHRSHLFRVRRREYAQELAERNGGRLL